MRPQYGPNPNIVKINRRGSKWRGRRVRRPERRRPRDAPPSSFSAQGAAVFPTAAATVSRSAQLRRLSRRQEGVFLIEALTQRLRRLGGGRGGARSGDNGQLDGLPLQKLLVGRTG